MSKKILVVEDSPTQAQRAQLILQKEGYEIILAQDGEEGLEKCLLEKPDLIVTDIVMPKMDGYEMCHKIKSNNNTKSIPVVMLTTKDEVMDIVQGLGVGADNFITKPYESTFLISHLKKIFENMDLHQRGELEEEGKQLEEFKGKIVLTKDREQILELLLSTLSVTICCNVLALLLFGSNGEHPFYLVSLQPLSPEACHDLQDKVLAGANVIGEKELSPSQLKHTFVVKEKDLPPFSSSFESFISVPLIIDGNIIGILSTANPKPEAFQADDVKLLFQLGVQSAYAFDGIHR